MIDLKPTTRWGIYSDLGLWDVVDAEDGAKEDADMLRRVYETDFKAVEVKIIPLEENEKATDDNNRISRDNDKRSGCAVEKGMEGGLHKSRE